jgi:hypothetical protein
MTDSFSFVVESAACDSEIEAWESFGVELVEMSVWVRGNHYWRKVPSHYTKSLYEEAKDQHIIRARVLSLREDDDIELLPVVIGQYKINPASNIIEDSESLTGFSIDNGA